MRDIAVRTLKVFWEKEPQAEEPLKAWNAEAEKATWESPQALKQQYRNASILSNKRVVFNIHGNMFRLIVDIEYRLKMVFVVWLGTHSEYDHINAKEIEYVKTD
jgi:mRNA interferase HigB